MGLDCGDFDHTWCRVLVCTSYSKLHRGWCHWNTKSIYQKLEIQNLFERLKILVVMSSTDLSAQLVAHSNQKLVNILVTKLQCLLLLSSWLTNCSPAHLFPHNCSLSTFWDLSGKTGWFHIYKSSLLTKFLLDSWISCWSLDKNDTNSFSSSLTSRTRSSFCSAHWIGWSKITK